MALRICLPDLSGPLIADTSVVINLTATGCAPNIIRALPNRVAIVDRVAEAIEPLTRRGILYPNQFSELVTEGIIDVVRLENEAIQYFEDLVIGPAVQTLDDDEAATIACAIEHGSVALIDEPKAIRICAERFPQLSIGWTTDTILHPQVQDQMGSEALADAVFNALCKGRMRVFPRHRERIIDLIGRERAVVFQTLTTKMPQPSKTMP